MPWNGAWTVVCPPWTTVGPAVGVQTQVRNTRAIFAGTRQTWVAALRGQIDLEKVLDLGEQPTEDEDRVDEHRGFPRERAIVEHVHAGILVVDGVRVGVEAERRGVGVDAQPRALFAALVPAYAARLRLDAD